MRPITFLNLKAAKKEVSNKGLIPAPFSRKEFTIWAMFVVIMMLALPAETSRWIYTVLGIGANMFMMWNRRPWQTPLWGVRFTKNLVCWYAGISGIVALVYLITR